jgi:hypothetical protein
MRCRIVAALWLALAGCNTQICARNSDCAVGLVCSDQGACVHPDPATPDAASTIDAAPDAPVDGPVDASPADAPIDARRASRPLRGVA